MFFTSYRTYRFYSSSLGQFPGCRTIHRVEELGVVLGFAHALDDHLHLFDARQRAERAAQQPDAAQIILWNQQFFLARAALLQIDGREDAFVRELAVEVDFQVARAFELLEDHFIHAATGIDQGRGHDRQAPAFFNVARRAEE